MVLVAGVDCSTTATKVDVRDAETGALVGTGRAPHTRPLPPRSEQDPGEWTAALVSAWHGATRAADGRGGPSASEVAALSVGAQQHGLVVLDRAGQVIRPAKLWNDTESAPDAAWLVSRLERGAPAWAERVGSVPVAATTITKLSWLHRTEPAHFGRLARICLPHDFVTLALTGRLVTDRGDASGTGYWSPADGRWCLDLLEIVDSGTDWSAALPVVLGPLEPAGENAGRLLPGLRPTTLVGAGTGDNMAAALALGLGPGDVCVSVGTSGTVSTVSERPIADGTGAVSGFADATGRFLPLVCTANAAGVLETVARLLGVGLDGLDALAQAAEPGAGGLCLLPFLDGERTPNRPGASGILAGLRSATRREDVARAAVEGVVCNLVGALGHLAAQVEVGSRVFLVGGGARSAAVRQVAADLLGRPVSVPDAGDLVAAGAAVQAAAVLEQVPPGAVAARWGLARGPATEPGPGAAAAGEILGRYKTALDASA